VGHPFGTDRLSTSFRAFILHHTALRPVPGLETIRLHLADDALTLWHAVQVETGDPDAALPYWAFAWGGGLAIGRYLRDQPKTVRGRRVFDLATGSGLCAVAAMQAGAASVTAVDIDPFAVAAVALNARANRQRVTVLRRDVLGDEPPDADVILAGDCCYEASLAERVLPWLQRARARGIDILVGDPGRRYLPTDFLVELRSYDVRTTTELEDLGHRQGRVYALRGRDADG
jgi:predicted nicotinamide N-methyase